jgi:hypothetical protein
VALQGAVGGAINADPGERGAGAALGAALGAGTYGVLKGAGKLASGIAEYSDDAKALRASLRNKDAFIPLNEGLSTTTAPGRALKTFYGLAAESPIGGAVMANQKTGLVDDVVAQVGDDAVPKSLGLQGLTFTADDAVGNTTNVAKVQEAINNLTAPLKGVGVKVEGSFWKKTVTKAMRRVQKADPVYAKDIQAAIDKALPPDAGPEVTMEGVLKAISNLKKLRSSVGGTSGTGRAQLVDDVIKGFENLGRERFKALASAKFPAKKMDLQDNWERSLKLFRDEMWAWKNMERAVAANNGKLDPKTLLAGLKGSASSRATMGIPNQRLISLADEVTNRNQQHVGGAFKTALELGPIAGGFIAGGPVGATLAAGVVPTLSTKAAQRFIVGDYASQKALADVLRSNPTLLRDIAARGTNALTPEGN